MTALDIAWRELRNLFLTPLAWCVLATVQFLLAFQFLARLEHFQLIQPRLLSVEGAPGVTDLVATPVLGWATTLMLLVVPLLTMRMFAEEKRSGTIRFLLSAPVPLWQVVLGKYLGLMGLLAIMVVMVLLMPVSLAAGTSLDWGKLAAATLGLFLMVAAFGALGLYFSTLTVQPVVAAIATFGALLLLFIIDWAGSAEVRFSEAFSYLSITNHYESMLRGVFSTGDVAYYLLFITTFLVLATRHLDAERMQR